MARSADCCKWDGMEIRERYTAFWIGTDDGRKLAVRYYKAQSPAWAAVWLGHAMMVNGTTYEHPPGTSFAEDLAAAGIETYVLDHRGHGDSGPPPHKDDSVTYDQIIRYDVPAATQLLRSRHTGLPAVAVGHSLAAHATLAYAGTWGQEQGAPMPNAIVGLAGNMWRPGIEPSRRRWVRKRFHGGIFLGLSRVMGRFPARLLKMGTDDVPGRFAPHFHKLAMEDTWESQDGVHDYIAGLSKVKVPVLAITGAGDDLLAHPAAWGRFHEPIPNCELWVEGKATGLDINPDHIGIVTHRATRPMRQKIVTWLRNRLAT